MEETSSLSPSDYFVTPRDIARGVGKLRAQHGLGLLGGILGMIVVYNFSGQGKEAAVFGGLLLSTLVWRTDARWLFGAAISCFGSIIAISALWSNVELSGKPISERMAVWSFYFLVIGVVLLITESYWPKDTAAKAARAKAAAEAKQEIAATKKAREHASRAGGHAGQHLQAQHTAHAHNPMVPTVGEHRRHRPTAMKPFTMTQYATPQPQKPAMAQARPAQGFNAYQSKVAAVPHITSVPQPGIQRTAMRTTLAPRQLSTPKPMPMTPHKPIHHQPIQHQAIPQAHKPVHTASRSVPMPVAPQRMAPRSIPVAIPTVHAKPRVGTPTPPPVRNRSVDGFVHPLFGANGLPPISQRMPIRQHHVQPVAMPVRQAAPGVVPPVPFTRNLGPVPPAAHPGQPPTQQHRRLIVQG